MLKVSVRLYAIGFAVLLSLALYLSFLAAYLSPTKAVILHIDRFGEANLELALFTASIPLVVYFGLKEWKRT